MYIPIRTTAVKEESDFESLSFMNTAGGKDTAIPVQAWADP